MCVWRKGADVISARQQLQKLLGRNGGAEMKFLDQQLEMTYQEELLFVRQVLAFCLVSLLVTLIGVFCLTMFESEYRRKEIGVRKVFGSTRREILLLFLKKYAWLLGIAFLVASPLAYVLGRRWLENFSERTPIYWWLFPLALVVVGVVTLGTVAIQSWRAASENPINSIKTE